MNRRIRLVGHTLIECRQYRNKCRSREIKEINEEIKEARVPTLQIHKTVNGKCQFADYTKLKSRTENRAHWRSD